MKRIKYLLIAILSFTSLHLSAISQETKQDNENKNDVKIYSENDFKKALKKELTKKFTQLGRGKIVKFANELVKKEDVLKIKELGLMKREERLNLDMQLFSKRIKEIDNKQNKIISCLDNQEREKEERVNHMVSAIANMRPVNAANVLSVQDADIAVKILGKLESIKVAKIFNSMDKEISARLQKQYMTMRK